MKMSKKTADALNKQMNMEFESAYIYLAMEAYFKGENLEGMASWMNKQVHEEWAHGMKLLNYLYERGAEAVLAAIPKPKVTWKTPLEAFQTALKHEQKVSQSILDVMKVTDQEKDKAAHIFLHWYVDEQVEEEDSVGTIVDKLKMVKGAPAGIYMLDKELGSRQ